MTRIVFLQRRLGVAPWTSEVRLYSDLTNLSSGDFVEMFLQHAGQGVRDVPYQAASAFAAAATPCSQEFCYIGWPATGRSEHDSDNE